jgi:SAM-dependent methyltransferase
VVPEVTRTLFEHFKPKSVIDFGCANALHIAEFRKLGVDTFGVEGTCYYEPYIKKNYDGSYIIKDLRYPFFVGKKFDLAICIEVLEHIEEAFGMVAVENICRHSDTLCVTASPTGGTRKHVNPQGKKYWATCFQGFSYKYERQESEGLERKFSGLEYANWMYENLMIYRRDEIA